jgi:tRNA threonylcarbamoyladenosine biosynthesis protein TsaB
LAFKKPAKAHEMKLLAIDCSTERMSVALAQGERRWTHAGAGGAQASAALIPAIMGLLDEAQLSLKELDAIAFGQGPGAFTGLRTACAVAQGLALGARLRLLPIDSLLMLAHAVLSSHTSLREADPLNNPSLREAKRRSNPQFLRVLSVLDARMGQVYAAAYEHGPEGWRCLQAPFLSQPEALVLPPGWQEQGFVLASNAHAIYPDAFASNLSQGGVAIEAWPQAMVMLDLAALAYARGESVSPAEALPLYVRDKVALTSAERLAANVSHST